jgi:hypothetical protein
MGSANGPGVERLAGMDLEGVLPDECHQQRAEDAEHNVFDVDRACGHLVELGRRKPAFFEAFQSSSHKFSGSLIFPAFPAGFDLGFHGRAYH